MLTEQEALSHVLARITPLQAVRVQLAAALHAFAVRPVHAHVPLPGFDNSAMDGYAVRAADTRSNHPLRVTGAIPAGGRADLKLEAGCAIRIFTGAPMPEGADAVIMQEDVTPQEEGREIVCREPVEVEENVRLLGCDLCAGQRIIDSGDRLTPARLAVMASQGLSHTEVAAAPRIAIVTTGDELIPPGEPLQPGMLYNSNATLLETLVRKHCARAQVTVRHIPDDLARTTEALGELSTSHDFIVLSGGVSVGEHDYVKPALQALGIRAELWRVKIKPGKPFLFATQEGGGRVCHFFGLPGNPVSVFVTFHAFVRPALVKAICASESEARLPQVSAAITTSLRNRGDRPHYIRGRHHAGRFTPLGLQQSHALFGLSQANAMLRMEPEQEFQEGDSVVVVLCGPA